MECNKEEAIRAKEIAETKMQNKDYSGARRVALKAQQLYPVLENISQLILVCDVHLSAESKAYGNEKDWYGILNIDSTADEASIKKQYRKFALLLHPDKNRFAGASDAFKLIGEAHKFLLDPVKRRLHDFKIKGSKPNCVANKDLKTGSQPSKSHFMGKTTSTSFTGFGAQQQQPVKPTQDTFWTMCPFCGVKFEYYRDVLNKCFQCQCCKKPFTGYEIKDQATSNHTPWFQPNHGASKPNGGEKLGSQGNVKFEPQKREPVAKRGTDEVGGDSSAEPESSRKVNNKRKTQTKRPGVKFDSNSRSKSHKKDTVEENGDVKNNQRSNCSKTNISFEQKDLGSPSKKIKRKASEKESSSIPVEEAHLSKAKPKETEKPKDGSSVSSPSKKIKRKGSGKEASSIPMEEDHLSKVKSKVTEKPKDGSSAMKTGEKTSVEANGGISPDVPEFYECPDPDFNDFDKIREDHSFTVGQVWALYDPLDAMPRFYARIKKIISLTKFKLVMTWLEADPDDEDEIKWAEAELPVSCGKLETGATETTTDLLMFSHRVDWEKGSKRDTYQIYPQKGETWALFKDWNINWHSDSESKRNYEYEFVEILSHYCEDNGVTVAYLGKVKGFSCLFCRTAREEADSFQIPRKELYRFSHRVPSFRLSGEERDGVPKNSFELDPASFPTNLVEIDIPKDPKLEVETVEISDENHPLCEEENKIESDSDRTNSFREEIPETSGIPEQEFFDFDSERIPEKFQSGQCWALYSDEDALPKYYAFIKKIVHQPEFKVQVTWLTASPSQNTINLPIGCGIFKHLKGSSSYTGTGPFSHLVKADLTDKKHECAIFPRKAEVWAVYKNWNARMTRADLENCEYDIVEVLEEKDFGFQIVMLEIVSGHKSVFKSQKKNGWILRKELLRFSHQIPAFRLTDEKGGSLRGYWELDLAALPDKKCQLG